MPVGAACHAPAVAHQRRLTVTLLALCTAATLTACGGTAAGSTVAATTKPATAAVVATASAAPASTTPAAAATAPADLPALAAKIGCTGYTQSSTPAPNADQWGTCTLTGKPVKLYLIPTDAGYQAFLASVKAYGVTEAWMVRSAPFVVAPDDQTQIPAIKAALGVS